MFDLIRGEDAFEPPCNTAQNTAFTYDLNGNPTTYKANTPTWDAENRMACFGSLLTAGYRADGLRAWKQTSAGRTYYLYDGKKPVLEENNVGAKTAVATFGPNGLLKTVNDKLQLIKEISASADGCMNTQNLILGEDSSFWLCLG